MKKNEELDDDLNIEAAMEDDGATSGTGIFGTIAAGIAHFFGYFFH